MSYFVNKVSEWSCSFVPFGKKKYRKTASFCIPVSCISLDVEATEAPAFDVVLKADKKRLELLEEVCYFFIIL